MMNRVAALCAITLVAAPAQAMPVKVDGGRMEGQGADGLTVYKGVPFAEPPVGELRWRAPRPVKAWSGVRQATTFAPACMQTGVSMPGETPPVISEDCLYLNVWTPAKVAGERLPVLVWIPGGGFSSGSASMPLYWGDRLAKEGAVVVTVGYRVGPLGFLAHPELTAESPQRSSGNFGLEDQIAALRWVQRNIAAFGGDPGRVTIAGQSAGAISVSILMASPLARGLFHRAIGQSGGLFEPLQLAPSYQLPNAEREGVAYATSVGARSLAELRRLPASALLQGKTELISHPVIEPHVLPASPYGVFAAGRQHDVPILIGSNADEARSLTVLTEVKAATFADDIARRWGPLPPEIIAAYPNATDEEARKARAAFERDLRFGWDMWAWARLQSATGKSRVYYYRFGHEPPFPSGSPYEGWGAAHFAELWYMFDHLDQEHWPWRASDRALARAMTSYWINFVRSGDPNGPGLPAWPAFSNADSKVQQLRDPISVGVVVDLKTLQVFDAVYGRLRGAPNKAGP